MAQLSDDCFETGGGLSTGTSQFPSYFTIESRDEFSNRHTTGPKKEAQVVTIPGAGFGPGGEGFLRLSAFAPREACEDACKRLKVAMAK